MVLKYGSTANHQRVRSLECRAAEFGFDLRGNGRYKESGEECVLYPDDGVIKALSRGVMRPDLYFSKMQPGEGSEGFRAGGSSQQGEVTPGQQWRKLLPME